MDVQLTQKEQMYLQDMLSMKSCVSRNTPTTPSKLKIPSFSSCFANMNNTKSSTMTASLQLLQGQAPSMTSGQQGGQSRQGGQQQWQSMPGSQVSGYSGLTGQSDAQLCQDALTTEKYISGAYDTAIFESANPVVRQTLQHIQQEEQQHGEGIFHYMHARGMYEVQ